MGRVKKISRLSDDMISDCLRDCSKSGPSTRARMKGASSYSSFTSR